MHCRPVDNGRWSGDVVGNRGPDLAAHIPRACRTNHKPCAVLDCSRDDGWTSDRVSSVQHRRVHAALHVAGIAECVVSAICIVTLPSGRRQRSLLEESAIETSTMDKSVFKFMSAARDTANQLAANHHDVISRVRHRCSGAVSVRYLWRDWRYLRHVFSHILRDQCAGVARVWISSGQGYAVVLFCSASLVASIGYFLLALPAVVPELTHKAVLLLSLSIVGGGISGSFTTAYLLLEKTANAYGIRDRNKLKLMISAWISACFSIGCTEGQIFVGGMFYQWFGFYQSALLQGCLTLSSGMLGIACIYKNGLMRTEEARSIGGIDQGLKTTATGKYIYKTQTMF